MSQKPRRTSELVQEAGSSTSRPSRISRIVQPTRTTLGLLRYDQRTSSDPSITQGKNSYLSTALRPQRSISATPQRTPLRMKTPTRQSQLPQQVTAEKERFNDKNWITSESARIGEYLRVIEPVLGKEFFERGGLKNMSTKQFIIIVNYFFKLIGGSRLSVGSNHIESMSKILNEIHYPHTVAKSWLKTPTAPHAFHNVILLFTWFLTFIPSNPLIKPINQIEEFEKNYISESKDFPDKAYACNFVRESREIFSAWNNGSDNVVEEAKIKLANDMIQKVCNLNGLNDLECRIKGLKEEDDKIQSDLKEDSKDADFNRLDKEYKLKIKEVDKYKKICKSNLKEINELKLQIELKNKSIKTIESEIEEILFEIKNQKMNIEERDNFVREINELNHELKVKTDNIMHLQEEGNENQIIFSRLVCRKTALITKMNTFIYKLFTEIKLLNLFDFDEFNLNKDCEIEDIEQVKNNLQGIFEKLILHLTRIENEVKKLEELVTSLNTEEEKFIKPTLEKYNKQIDDLNKDLKKIDEFILINMNENEKFIKELDVQLNDLIYSKNHMLNELKIKTDKLKEMKESNLETWNDFENKMEAILTYREQRADVLSEAIDDFDKTMDGLQKIYFQE